jgi:GNAT superfamily N-acetyltransferase
MSRFITTLEDVEITRAKDVAKHGDHDQSSHGSWAQGLQVAPEIVRSTLESVKANGGLTVDMKDGSSPKDGFMVAKGKKFAAIVKADDFFDEAKGAEILSSYMKQHKSEFNNSNNYLGLWHNTNDGQVYLDVSENIKDEGEAISRGRERDQISIWDVANLKEIETGGTGGIEKTRSGTTARFVEHDGRADRRLRQRDLGKVSKTLKVIYFDYGLKPVLKHEGHEDQSSHGNWATGRSEEDVKRISEFKNRGPSIALLDKSLEDTEPTLDRDKAKMMIDNDSKLDGKVEDRIAALVATIEEQNGEPMSEEDRLANYDDYRNQVIEEYMDEEPNSLENFSQREYGESIYEPKPIAELQESLNDVYGLERTATFKEGDRQGESVTLTSSVDEVTVQGNILRVVTNIRDEMGNQVNDDEIIRYLEKNEETGTWSVEHNFLRLNEEYRGLGFGGKFLQQSEDYYVAKGFTHITLNAGLEDGARHWANSGFDWNRDKLDFAVEQMDRFITETERRAKQDYFTNNDDTDITLSETNRNILMADLSTARAILGRMGTPDNLNDMKNDSFPKPRDFASLGADRPITLDDGTKTYSGKILLSGKYLPYMKILTAEGQNLLSGPIDMDGDGMVYDGTPREKPVSSVGKD